jgi:hypothetical protein
VRSGLSSPLYFNSFALYSFFFFLFPSAVGGENFFSKMSELPIIQKTYDLIKWYVPILNRLPRDHKFILGDRMISGLYDLLDGLIIAKYASDKLSQLESLCYNQTK